MRLDGKLDGINYETYEFQRRSRPDRGLGVGWEVFGVSWERLRASKVGLRVSVEGLRANKDGL